MVSLAYSLVTYVSIGETMARESAVPRADGSRDAVGTSSVLPPANRKLIVAALAALFDAMDSGGTWDKGQPIFLSRGKGNDVGNAFVFAPDMLATLLESLPVDLFRPHVRAIGRHAEWLRQNQVHELVADPERYGGILPSAAVSFPAELRGWRSNHLPPGGPLAWSTAQAVRCLARISGLTRQLINADVLAALGGRGPARPDAAAWDRLLDSDLSAAEGAEGDSTTLKATLEQRMLEPLAALAAADPASGQESYSALLAAASYSAILFGPPGEPSPPISPDLARTPAWPPPISPDLARPPAVHGRQARPSRPWSTRSRAGSAGAS